MNRRQFVLAGATAALAWRGRGLLGQSAEAVNAALIQTPLELCGARSSMACGCFGAYRLRSLR